MIVQDGINGLLTPVDDVGALADALATMMSDPQRRAQMGQSAQQVVDRFSLDTILMQWDNLFSELG